MPNQVFLDQLLIFVNLYKNAKYRFIPSFHASDTVILLSPFRDPILIFVNLYQIKKIKAVSSICSGKIEI